MTYLCFQLYRDFHHEGWNEYDLEKLPRNELRFLCYLMGIAHSGTKADLIVRLLTLRLVRKDLSKFGSDHDALLAVVAEFKRSRLRWMCQQANLWKSGNKIQLASVLLSWRNRCRQQGLKFLEEWRAAASKAQQLALKL
ncbi:MAG TPA: hypothetical protein VG167_01025 [Verrucomicrobiae bacterium]|nr:hypothetical protein [Verrucomicrobiae bacterium]